MDTRAEPSGRPARTPARTPGHQPRPARPGSWRRLGSLAAAVLLAAGLVILYLWAVRTADGQRADIHLLVVLQDLNPALGPTATALRPGLVVAGALVCGTLGVLALSRRRWRSLAAAAVVVALSVGGTWLLKAAVLDRPYLGANGYTVNTFPSGHVSATLALVVATAQIGRASCRERVF